MKLSPARIAGRVRHLSCLLWHAMRAAGSPAEIVRNVNLFREVRPYTMVQPPRLANLLRLSRRAERAGIEGAVVECGTCNGGTAGILAVATARSCRPLWLFDSFEGLPEPTEEDGPRAQGWQGRCLGAEERVRELLGTLGQEGPRVRIVKGWFQDTLPGAAVGPVALLHVDADWYDSVRLVLERFYPEVTPGGFVVLDDYGCWEGCRRATDEFLRERGIPAKLVRVDETGVWFRKPVGDR